MRRSRHLRRLTLATACGVLAVVCSGIATAGASTVASVTFTGTAPTSVVANAASTWTVGFTTSATGALSSLSTITVTMPYGVTTSSTAPTVTLLTPSTFASNCARFTQDSNELNVITITIFNSGGTCSLPASTAATLSVAVVNGPGGAYGAANFAVATSADTTAVAPAVGATITPTAVTAVTVTGTAPTSVVKAAASTWTWGFTTSSNGLLNAGDTITLSYPAGFTTLSATPVVALVSPSSFATGCAAVATDTPLTGTIVVTLANNGSNTCVLAGSTAATLSVGVVNGTTDVLTTLSLATSMDTTPVSPTGTAPVLTAATAATAVTFTATAPTSLVAAAASTWTVGLTSSSGGALAAGSYLVVKLPSGFTTATTTPAVTLLTPASLPANCTPSGSDSAKSNVVVVTLANNGSNTCALAGSTAATLNVAVVNGPAATDGPTTFSVLTSSDGTAVAPTSGTETIVAAGPPATPTHWAPGASSSSGEAHGGAAPGVPASPLGAATSGYLCASSTSEVVELTWSPVVGATSYVVEQATTAAGTYSAATPTPVYSGASATITYTTAVTEYFKIEAVIGSSWVSTLSSNAVNGSVAAGFVVTSTSTPKCTNS